MLRMKASADYGLRIVFFLACEDRAVSSLEISEKMAIPRDYVIQLATRLRNAGILKSTPGRRGGYKLARPLDKISALQIVEAFDYHQHAKHDIKRKRDPQAVENQVRHMHEGILFSFCSFLDSITVEDLMVLRDGSETMEAVAVAALEEEAAKLREKDKKKAAKKK